MYFHSFGAGCRFGVKRGYIGCWCCFCSRCLLLVAVVVVASINVLLVIFQFLDYSKGGAGPVGTS